MDSIRFKLLGPLAADRGGVELELGPHKERALLALLLLNANRVIPTSRLIDELWGDAPPETARKALQVYVSRLRKVLGPGRLTPAHAASGLRTRRRRWGSRPRRACGAAGAGACRHKPR